ncbi:hypothetical protein [Streptomyces sp. WZ.A104]|uniref:hypothetical protein n=1 Tax=Streptomyces sp. WZ.A104 TaxID=2023771 RepID=UPI0015C99724|nr:hypothetical protein [Streptomyces sp. WZ.A104]
MVVAVCRPDAGSRSRTESLRGDWVPRNPFAGLRLRIRSAEQITGRRIQYTVLPLAAFSIGGRFIGQLGETQELLPRYGGDNIFDTASWACS